MDKRLFVYDYFLAVIQLLDREGKSMEEIRKLVIAIASGTAFPNMPPCSLPAWQD